MKSKTIEAARGKCGHLHRRTFLKVTSVGTALGVFGESLFGSLVYADTLGKEKRDKMTPDEILAKLTRGNKNFSKGLMTARNYRNEQKTTAKGQFPAAVVLSCIDSRASSSMPVWPATSQTRTSWAVWNLPARWRVPRSSW